MRLEKDNAFDTFDDWLMVSHNGVPNASLLNGNDFGIARDAWTHGFEAGHHEGHVDGWRLAAPMWQMIATAPKDNTRVLLWDGHIVRIGSWYREKWTGDDYDRIEATHWMSLFEPPTAETSDAPSNT